jgi:hypothetical protein
MPSEVHNEDLVDFFGRDKIFGNATRPIHIVMDEDEDDLLYRRLVGPDKSSIAPLSATETGYYHHVPIEVTKAAPSISSTTVA